MLLLILLILLLCCGGWGWHAGYAPGPVGIVVFVLILMLLFGSFAGPWHHYW